VVCNPASMVLIFVSYKCYIVLNMTSKRTEQKALVATIYTALFNRIYEGVYTRSTRLKEEDLAHEFSTSRSPIRKVLSQLDRVGLVKLVPNRGAVVIGITNDDIEEIYEIRKSLELLALNYAFPYIRLERLGQIRARIASIDANDTVERITAVDLEFHNYLIQSSQRPRLAENLKQLFCLIERFGPIVFTDPEGVERVKQEHLQVIEAVFDRDLDSAKRILADHIDRSKEFILKYLFHHRYEEGDTGTAGMILSKET
jgi:DNA-binding GntR family transcriptional regulator